MGVAKPVRLLVTPCTPDTYKHDTTCIVNMIYSLLTEFTAPLFTSTHHILASMPQFKQYSDKVDLFRQTKPVEFAS